MKIDWFVIWNLPKKPSTDSLSKYHGWRHNQWSVSCYMTSAALLRLVLPESHWHTRTCLQQLNTGRVWRCCSCLHSLELMTVEWKDRTHLLVDCHEFALRHVLRRKNIIVFLEACQKLEVRQDLSHTKLLFGWRTICHSFATNTRRKLLHYIAETQPGLRHKVESDSSLGWWQSDSVSAFLLWDTGTTKQP